MGARGQFYRVELLPAGLISMSVLVDVPGLVTGVVVMLARLVLHRFVVMTGMVAMAVLVQIAGRVPGVIVVLAGLFVRHWIHPPRLRHLERRWTAGRSGVDVLGRL